MSNLNSVYLAGICRNQRMAPIAINGMSTTRISFSLAANDSLAKAFNF